MANCPELIAAERFWDFHQGEGVHFLQLKFDETERDFVSFKGGFISGLPQSIDDVDEDYYHVLGTCWVVSLGESLLNCRSRENWRRLKTNCLKKPEPERFGLVTREEKMGNCVFLLTAYTTSGGKEDPRRFKRDSVGVLLRISLHLKELILWREGCQLCVWWGASLLARRADHVESLSTWENLWRLGLERGLRWAKKADGELLGAC